MNEILDRLAEDLDWRRRQSRTADCLDDDVLNDLAAGRLEAARARSATGHLKGCLECLHAYASLRGLTAETSDEVAETSDEAAAMTPSPSATPVSRRAWERLFEMFRWRIPLGWSVATAMATAVVVWLAYPAMRTTSSPGPWPMAEFSSREAPSRSSAPASTPAPPPRETAPRTVTGTVERVEPKDTEGVKSYVVILTERPGGATYVVFAWGTPTVRAGQSVQARGVFMPLDVAPPGRYQGVATDLRRVP